MTETQDNTHDTDDDAIADVTDTDELTDEQAEAAALDSLTEAGEPESFPEPEPFNLEADEVPVDDEERDVETDMPVDDDAFAGDADKPEFLEGETDSFVDDSRSDYYDFDYDGDGVAEPGEHSPELSVDDDSDDTFAPADPEDFEAVVAPAPVTAPKTGRHGAVKVEPEHVRRSRRTRRILIVVLLLLLVTVGVLAWLGYNAFLQTQENAQQDARTTQANDVTRVEDADTQTRDDASTAVKTIEVPALASVMGKQQDEAVKLLGHGATVTNSIDIDEEGNPQKKRVTVTLTDDPADAKTGAPSVYLGLDEGGAVIMAGYSTSTASLGYGSLSFADAIGNEHIIERTLNQAGLNVAEGTVVLPDASAYATYSPDHKTLLKESASFDGEGGADQKQYRWSSVLTYDYSAANASGRLGDTIRTIYVYINA